jgi:hypothetical protein
MAGLYGASMSHSAPAVAHKIGFRNVNRNPHAIHTKFLWQQGSGGQWGDGNIGSQKPSVSSPAGVIKFGGRDADLCPFAFSNS